MATADTELRDQLHASLDREIERLKSTARILRDDNARLRAESEADRSKLAEARLEIARLNKVVAEQSSSSNTLVELQDSLPEIRKAVADAAIKERDPNDFVLSIGENRVTVEIDGPTLYGEAAVELPGWREGGLPFAAKLVGLCFEVE